MNRHNLDARQIWSGMFQDYFVLSTIVIILLGLISLPFIDKGDVVIWLGHQRTYVIHYVFYIWTTLAEEEVFIGLTVLFALFLSIRRGLSVSIIGIVSLIISFLLKKIFQHPRPREFFAEEMVLKTNPIDGFHVVGGMTSFPSGHTIGAFALFGFIALSLRNRILSSLCFVIALGVGISRIYLIHHFLQDVLFGAAIGLLMAMCMHWLLDQEKVLAGPSWMKQSLKQIWKSH